LILLKFANWNYPSAHHPHPASTKPAPVPDSGQAGFAAASTKTGVVACGGFAGQQVTPPKLRFFT